MTIQKPKISLLDLQKNCHKIVSFFSFLFFTTQRRWAIWNSLLLLWWIWKRRHWFKTSWKDDPWPRQSACESGTQQSVSIAHFFLSVSSVLPRLPSTFTSRTPGGLCWNSKSHEAQKMKAKQLTSHKLLNQHQITTRALCFSEVQREWRHTL